MLPIVSLENVVIYSQKIPSNSLLSSLTYHRSSTNKRGNLRLSQWDYESKQFSLRNHKQMNEHNVFMRRAATLLRVWNGEEVQHRSTIQNEIGQFPFSTVIITVILGHIK